MARTIDDNLEVIFDGVHTHKELLEKALIKLRDIERAEESEMSDLIYLKSLFKNMVEVLENRKSGIEAKRTLTRDVSKERLNRLRLEIQETMKRIENDMTNTTGSEYLKSESWY